ncbi:glycerol-3-phosphate dehydrogenase/oxidase [Corynebacterium diphtheriae]|uniref:glycerol-3-phosphate dehydrogenase/oxidase n=1 Tax=Corynebacterium diphtheriae TaxID=1717 RepID=UPI0003192DD1|nr:glycerol-3-phosphate dehydrogenase/oxidase [Corynebacterium diphtheriae]
MTTKSHCTFNPDYYQDVWQRFGEEEYDVVVIGGGSVGAGAGLDAAIRGLKVAVVESRDFAAGTSSRSSKMFHGGLRYLAMLDFKLVAESLHERELNMSTLAPHLVKPLKFLFPLTHHVWERVMMFGGFTLYDLMGGAKSVPMQKHYSRKGTLAMAPGLKDDAVVGSVRYFDTLVDDARHTMTVLRTAGELGADVRPSTQVVGFEKDGQRVVGAILQDTDTGEKTTIRGKVFINATGVWNDHIEKLAGGKYTTYRVIGKDAVDLAAEDLDFRVPASESERTPILGADGYHALQNQAPRIARTFGTTEDVVEHLLGRYGSLVHEVLEPSVDKPELLEPIPGAPGYIKAEAVYAVTHEGALHVEDIVERRLRAGIEYADRGVAAAPAIAELVADYLGWDAERTAAEVTAFTDRVSAEIAAEKELTDKAANEHIVAGSAVRSYVDVSGDN